MDNSKEIQRLRRLLGPQRFDAERQKGKNLRLSKVAGTLQGESEEPEFKGPENERPGKHVNRAPVANSATEENTEINSANAIEMVGSRNTAKGKLSGFHAPWSDPEDSEEDLTENFKERLAFEEQFCPILAVSRFPYKYLSRNKDLMEDVARVCFNNGKFWERRWTIFFLHVPEHISTKPLLLVPAKEVENLLAEVHQRLNTKVKFPHGRQCCGFCISFTDKDKPCPRYLGVSRSRADFDDMQDKIPSAAVSYDATLASENDMGRSWSAWTKKVEEAVQAARNKKARKNAKSKAEKTNSKRSWHQQLCNAQRYLGLRPINSDLTEDVKPEEALQLEDRFEHPPHLDVKQKPSFSRWRDSVLISIDVEANERVPSMITEVGIATLDTRDLEEIPPGTRGENWRSHAKYRHFRIEEYKNHVNSEFLSGCPDRFERSFGQSEFVKRADLPRAIALSCKPPFHNKVAGLLNVHDSIESNKADFEARNIIVLGHNIASDIQYLKSVGFDILGLSGLVEVLDTSAMYQAMVRETQTASLASLLHLLQITGWNLHNAGNDAAYCLQAFIGIAVEYLAEDRYRKHEEDAAKRRDETIRLVAERFDDEHREWLEASGI